jgi:hypothetical protein
MAMETFGVVAGALSVAALFNSCVDCFGYVQLGRNLGLDYEHHKLKLSLLQARLSRWGETAAVHDDPRFATTSPNDDPTQRVQSVLEGIELLFQAARETSNRYEQSAAPNELVIWDENDLPLTDQRLRRHLGQVVHERQRQISFVKKTAWALWDGKNLDKLIGQIAGLVDDLEKICPATAAHGCQLAQLELKGIDEGRDLTAIQDAAGGVDNILAKAAQDKADMASRNRAGRVDIQDEARLRIGSHVSEAVLARGFGMTDRSSNSTDSVNARGRSRVHIGASFGGRDIFDD